MLWVVAIPALTVLALAVRLYAIDRQPLWLDEGYTLLFSGMPLPKLLTVGGAHEHPPLYYLIVHFVRRLHESYLVPRYVSAVSGALTVPALAALGARVHSRPAGLVAAALLAVAPFHVWFSRDGRGYELAGLVVVLSYYLLFTALRDPRRRTWALYAVVTALCLYAEYTTAFALAPQLVAVAVARGRGITRPLFVAWAAVAVLFAPWIGIVALDAASIAGNYWIPAPTLSAFSFTVLEFFGLVTSCSAQPCTGVELTLPALAGHEAVLALLASAVAVMVAAVAMWRRDFVATILALWLVAPFALLLLVSLRQSLFLDRVLLDATFPLYLLLGIGVAPGIRRPSRALLSLGVVLATIGAGLATLGPIFAQSPNPDWRAAMRTFGTAYRPGQSVAIYPGALSTIIAAYLPDGVQPRRVQPLWSRVYVDVPGWESQYPTLINPSLAQRTAVEAQLRDRQLRAATRGTRRTWLMTEDYPGISDVRLWFVDRGYRLVLGEEFANHARIELWSLDPPSALGPPVARLLDGHWPRRGPVSSARGVLHQGAGGAVTRSFPVRPGEAYSIEVRYRGVPPARPQIGLLVYDSAGRQMAAFPNDRWYDLPVNGAWLSNPFGFVAPPGAVRAMLYLNSKDGRSEWRDVAIYRER